MQMWKNSEELWNSNYMICLLGYNRVHVTVQFGFQSNTGQCEGICAIKPLIQMEFGTEQQWRLLCTFNQEVYKSEHKITQVT